MGATTGALIVSLLVAVVYGGYLGYAWWQWRRSTPEVREVWVMPQPRPDVWITLDAEDLEHLIRGGELQVGPVRIILQDIGYAHEIAIIERAAGDQQTRLGDVRRGKEQQV